MRVMPAGKQTGTERQSLLRAVAVVRVLRSSNQTIQVRFLWKRRDLKIEVTASLSNADHWGLLRRRFFLPKHRRLYSECLFGPVDQVV